MLPPTLPVMVRLGVALELRELFGTSLQQCRRARRLTQAQLVEATDLSLEMIGRLDLERGLRVPSFDTIAALVQASARQHQIPSLVRIASARTSTKGS